MRELIASFFLLFFKMTFFGMAAVTSGIPSHPFTSSVGMWTRKRHKPPIRVTCDVSMAPTLYRSGR